MYNKNIALRWSHDNTSYLLVPIWYFTAQPLPFSAPLWFSRLFSPSPIILHTSISLSLLPHIRSGYSNRYARIFDPMTDPSRAVSIDYSTGIYAIRQYATDDGMYGLLRRVCFTSVFYFYFYCSLQNSPSL